MSGEKRFHVTFWDVEALELLPDDLECWQTSFEAADRFASDVALLSVANGGRVLEASIYEDGELVHEHSAPRQLTTWS